MILSDSDIKKALRDGTLDISPAPDEDQYTTSAVDLVLGGLFRGWDGKRLHDTPGVEVTLDLAKHQFLKTADAYLNSLPLENDGSFLLRPYGECTLPVLGMTRE